MVRYVCATIVRAQAVLFAVTSSREIPLRGPKRYPYVAPTTYVLRFPLPPFVLQPTMVPPTKAHKQEALHIFKQAILPSNNDMEPKGLCPTNPPRSHSRCLCRMF
ncbi:unnamed protein product [Ectocarpus fasciculatus]